MKDIEARGVVLQFLYERRREGFYPDRDVSPLFQGSGRDEFYRVCKQLVDSGLVEWEAWEVPSERRAGYEWSAHSIRITPAGINAVESEGRSSPLPINFQQIVIQHSTGFQIGDHNSQSIAITFNQILRGIEEADAPTEAKEEAKGRVRELLEHPLVNTVLGAAASAILGAMG
jgi:hypothetical protein